MPTLPVPQSTMASTTKETLQAASGGTALHEAAKIGHAQLVNLLLDSGADIEATNKVGGRMTRVATPAPPHAAPAPSLDSTPAIWSPCSRAPSTHRWCPCLCLVAAVCGAHVWDPQFRSTPLIIAVQQGQVPAVEVLVARGADPNVQNFVRVAHLLACLVACLRCAHMLVQHD